MESERSDFIVGAVERERGADPHTSLAVRLWCRQQEVSSLLPAWYSPNEYVLVQRCTRRRSLILRLLEPDQAAFWIDRHILDPEPNSRPSMHGGLPCQSFPLRKPLVTLPWPPPYPLLGTQRNALSPSTLKALDACVARCTARKGWAPHDRLGYEFGELDAEFYRDPGGAGQDIVNTARILAAKTWGEVYAEQNRPYLAHGAGFLLRYTPYATSPPPPHLDIKALEGMGAQTGNGIVYLSSPEGGETVFLGAYACPPVQETDPMETEPHGTTGTAAAMVSARGSSVCREKEGRRSSIGSNLGGKKDTLASSGGGSNGYIKPQRGKMVLWRSYTDEGVVDPRARHTARTVEGTVPKVLLTLSLRRKMGP